MSSLLWLLASVAAGAGLAMQSRVNGELGARLEHGILAALISFAVGLVLLGGILLVSRGARAGVGRLIGVLRDGSMPWWYATTGLFGAYLVATQGIVVGTTGVALYTVGLVAGQTASGLAVDRAGFGGLTKRPVTAPRVVGGLLALVAVGIALAGAGQIDGSWLVVLPFAAGLLQSFQQAFSGLVQRHSRSAVAQTLSNFLLGTAVLAVVVGVQSLAGVTAAPLPAEPWLYTGGAFGIVFMAVMSLAVHRLGVLTMGLGAISGQVLASVLLDLTLPVGHPVTVWSLLGAALTMVAVVVSAIRPRRPGTAQPPAAPLSPRA